jgi:hypothetical protein
VPAAIALALGLAGAAPGQHPSQDIAGLGELLDRLGDDAPTGAGIVVAQVEVADGEGDYGPNQDNHVQFGGKSFFAMSGDPGVADHASTVGKFQYGLAWSLAPDVNDIYLYEVNSWLTSGFLRFGTSFPPYPLPSGDIKSINHSWIGDAGSSGANNNVLRRADWAANRDDLLVTNGIGNPGHPNIPLLSHLYNSITVGFRAGGHVHADTIAGIDGPGRMKPDMVGPENVSSYATPIVNAAGSVLVETARTDSGLAGNPNAENPRVLKAILMAGAVHEDQSDGQWSNEPDTSGPSRGVTDRPIDFVVGAGLVNVNRSHLIMTGLEQDGGALTSPGTTEISWRGWDHATVAEGESVFYPFTLAEDADEISIVATWFRWVQSNFGAVRVADFDLTLWRLDGAGLPVTLVGDPGLPYFGGGNVASNSKVDPLEHLYLTDLAAGSYAIELAAIDTDGLPVWDAAVAWLMPEPSYAAEDVNQDGKVDFQDLLLVLVAWGPCPGCPEDVDGDGEVDLEDLLLVLAGWDP